MHDNWGIVKIDEFHYRQKISNDSSTMHHSPQLFPRHVLSLAFVACLALVGCNSEPGIEVHNLPKSNGDSPDAPPAESSDDTDNATGSYRMLVAMMPHGGQAWSFKVTGGADVLQAKFPDFMKFVEGVKFKDGKPTWNLPDGWKESAGGNQFRYATITMPTDSKPLTLKVANFAENPDWDNYTLQNVNRWRGQVGAGPIGLDQLAEGDGNQSGMIKLILDPEGDKVEARIFNIEGPKDPDGGGGMAPFMQGR